MSANVAKSFAQFVALATAAVLSACSTTGVQPGADAPPSQIELARTSIGAGNLSAAETLLTEALRPRSGKARSIGDRASAEGVAQSAGTAELLLLRAEVRIRQGRHPEAESDALTAMALVPPTPVAEPPAPPVSTNADAAPPPRRAQVTQRSIHLRIAQLYEDVGHDSFAEHHILAARDLCKADPALVERHECERERKALVRIRIARGKWNDAEPLVLEGIADVQSRYGAEDIRLSVALCEAAKFYARQGSYALSGPLFARSFSLWKASHDEALGEHQRALAQNQPSPFDAEFVRPRAGYVIFAAPCGLDDQPALLYKLGMAGPAADAARYEQQLWAADATVGEMVVRNFDAVIARGAPPLDVAAARNAVAFVARKKGDVGRAEQELRLATDAYAAAWPGLPLSEKRFVAEDYLKALESLIEILRASQRFPEALTLSQRAIDVAGETTDSYDSVRLDTLLSQAITYREQRDVEKAEAAAGRYLDAVVKARGDRSADYAWALRTISFAYLLGEALDASSRMEMQAKAIWAKQGAVAPEFFEGQPRPARPRPAPPQSRGRNSRGRAGSR